jgi:hypothetical protein
VEAIAENIGANSSHCGALLLAGFPDDENVPSNYFASTCSISFFICIIIIIVIVVRLKCVLAATIFRCEERLPLVFPVHRQLIQSSYVHRQASK